MARPGAACTPGRRSGIRCGLPTVGGLRCDTEQHNPDHGDVRRHPLTHNDTKRHATPARRVLGKRCDPSISDGVAKPRAPRPLRRSALPGPITTSRQTDASGKHSAVEPAPGRRALIRTNAICSGTIDTPIVTAHEWQALCAPALRSSPWAYDGHWDDENRPTTSRRSPQACW